MYLPPRVTLFVKILQDTHILTLHGGVDLTMARMRQDYWIPCLKQFLKNVISHCYGCKKFHAQNSRTSLDGGGLGKYIRTMGEALWLPPSGSRKS